MVEANQFITSYIDIPLCSTVDSVTRADENIATKEKQDDLIPADIADRVESIAKDGRKDMDDLEITLWDFAGHDVYYTTHQVSECVLSLFFLAFLI